MKESKQMQSARTLVVDITSFLRETLRDKIGSILCFELIHRTLVFLVFAPVSVFTLQKLVDTWGKPSIGNFEIAAFLISWPGIATMIIVGGLFLTQWYFESAGLILIIRPAQGRNTIVEIIRYLLGQWIRLFRLGLIQMTAIVARLFPTAFLTIVILNRLWQGHDINSLIILRPPIFWLGVGIGSILSSISLYFIARLFLRWFLALPILLLDEPRISPREALNRSVLRTSANRLKIISVLTCMVIAETAFAAIVLAAMRVSADWFLDQVGTSLLIALPATVIVLAIHAVILILLSIIVSVGFTCIILYLDHDFSGRIVNTTDHQANFQIHGFKQFREMARCPLFSGLVALALIIPIGCFIMINRLDLNDNLEIIAHRAGGALAPENTVSAVKNAISIGAEWAEIDVQLTSDNKIIVAHDTDLRRLGGLNQTIGESTLEKVQSVDVGIKFNQKFKGEKIPTLEEFLEAGKGRIHVLIELKPHNPKDGVLLAAAVVDLLQRRNEIHWHRICSQSYEAIEEAKRLAPDSTIGFIGAQAIGPMDALNVDFLMIDQKVATRKMIDRCKALNKKVLAWTVDNPEMVLPLLDRGVDGIITDNPPIIAARLNEIRGLNSVQRLILRARNALAD